MNQNRPWSIDDITPQHGRRVIISGTNSGIGDHTATILARKGVEVVLASSDEQRGTDGPTCRRNCPPPN